MGNLSEQVRTEVKRLGQVQSSDRQIYVHASIYARYLHQI